MKWKIFLHKQIVILLPKKTISESIEFLGLHKLSVLLKSRISTQYTAIEIIVDKIK